MIHISTELMPSTIYCESATAAACGVVLEPDDRLTEAALHSNCNACRAVVNIGPMSQKGCAYTEEPRYTPEPMQGIETLAEIYSRRG